MKRVVCTCVLLLVSAGAAFAQESSWGVAGSFVPSWNVPSENEVFRLLFDADALDVTGSELRIGFVRGRTLGGDWGVSFVRRKIDDGSTVTSGFYDDPEIGFAIGEFTTTHDVLLNGIEVHKFTPFGTIKQRVQIGLLYGGGVGATRGTLETRIVDADFQFVGNGTVFRRVETNESRDAKELILPGNGVTPLGRLELAVAGIIAPGLKIRASGGFNYPGTHTFSVGGVYLFGVK